MSLLSGTIIQNIVAAKVAAEKEKRKNIIIFSVLGLALLVVIFLIYKQIKKSGAEN